MTLAAETLTELRGKYARMLAMRLAHRDGVEDADSVSTQMADLAVRFPGALREIDQLPLETIEARVASLDAALVGASAVPAWAEAMALFHALMRGALVAKRWLAGRRAVGAETTASYRAALPTLPFADDAAAWAEALARLAAPPRGRVVEVVFARLAESLGVPVREARRLTFGERRSRVLATSPTS